jgi:hypothetical protein
VSETPTEPAPSAPQASPGSRTRQSAADMLRTLAVILAVVAVIVLLVVRPNEVTQPDVDPSAAALAARPGLSFVPAVPAGLPAGWAARTAEVQSGTDGVAMWSLQYKTPGGDYGAVRQARGATRDWEARQVTDGREDGTVAVAGRQWTVRSRTDRGITSWVLHVGDLTTIITGTASTAELETLATHLPAGSLDQPVASTSTPLPATPLPSASG